MIGSFSQFSSAIEPLLLIGASVGTAILALAVYRNDRSSATNRIFAALSIFMMLWLGAPYMSVISPENTLIFHRFAIFFAAPTSALLFLLAHTLPNSRIQLNRFTLRLVVVLTALMMAVNISPFAFAGLTADGNPIPGVGLALFGIMSTVFSVLAIFYLVKKSFINPDHLASLQLRTVLIGMLIMLALVIGTVLVPIAVFHSAAFLPFIPLYVLIFLGMTAYSIIKYQLFNIKVLLAQALTLVIWVVLFAKIFAEESLNAQIIDGLVLLFTIVFGFFLVRSVKREVEQRELIQKQEQELEIANQAQENLLRFISHEVKGYLAKSSAAFAMIAEGDYGQTSPELHTLAQTALADTRKGVDTVMDILNAGNLKRGTVSFTMQPFDFKEAVEAIVKEHEKAAQDKKLTLTFSCGEGDYTMVGDASNIGKHVLNNLVDNAIKYTPKGKVLVSLSRTGDHILFSITDSGVGITEEDKKRLFTEGGRGKESLKVNVHSTGYGLFIAKRIIDAHQGKIWATSEGTGKGSTFYIELPRTAQAISAVSIGGASPTPAGAAAVK